MKPTITNCDSERFQTGVSEYAAYLETPEGRLRLDLAVANLVEFLPQPTQTLCALDIGAGTGAIGVRLAQLGLHVTLLDASRPMLDFAERAARKAEVTEKVELRHGDARELATLCDGRTFDVIVCHNLLEYVDEPDAVLRQASRLLRGRSGVLSVLVRNRAGEVLKAAIQGGDLAASERNLTSEWAQESLYRGKVRLFDAEKLRSQMVESSLAVVAERGVRVVSDYLPAKVSSAEDYQPVFELERKLGKRPEFAAVARYTQILAITQGP